ncbi:MAG: FG-GAP-like repeat-containing protein [Gemmataceae bacterium]
MCRTALALLLAAAAVAAPQPPKDELTKTPAGFVRFRVQEIDRSLKVGYAVITTDVNGDGKPDIVVVDTNQVVWYENPTWKKRVIISGQTKTDNVCIAAADIDGDGQIDFALGADWGALNRTRDGGTIQWLQRGKTLDEPWTVHAIGEEPSVHRMRFVDFDGSGKPKLVVVPLMGRNATAKANWVDGQPTRVLAYPIPADPVKGRWVPDVISESLHVIHGFAPVAGAGGRPGFDLLAASYEGVSLIGPDAKGAWKTRRVGEGDQGNPTKERGASEVKQGRLKNGKRFLATIEPWHGNRVVVYTPPDDPTKLWDRQTPVDSRLRWGHAVWCADLDGDGDDELIVGVRDDPRAGDTFPDRRGVRIYRCTDGIGAHWDERIAIDPNGVAVEDLTVADLDGDGKPEIIAVGRATGNLRVYWNIGK